MRDLFLIAGIAVAAILIGGAFFLFGPSSLRPDVNSALVPDPAKSAGVSYTQLAKGMNAVAVTDRTNYRITNPDDLAALWTLVYGTQNPPAMPQVDFSKYEVLALFDGSHSTTGYSISIKGIKDQDATRTVDIFHGTPDSSCSVRTGKTSPFIVIRVPKTTFSLAHEDMVGTTTCP